MDSSWVYLYSENAEIVYDMITMPVPPKKRSLAKRVVKTAVVIMQIILWAKEWV